MATGRFITFEGGEGVGKTTQVELLAETLRARGLNVTTTREPGGSPGAEDIRELLLDPSADWTPASETLLHFAARANHYTTLIAPTLKRGEWVICDRFADSTRAYQGYGMGLELSAIETLYELALGDFEPDLTLILDIPAEVAAERLRKREGAPDRYERMDMAFHRRLRDGFLDIAARRPDRCRVIPADGSPDCIAARIRDVVMEKLSGEGGP